MTRPMHYSAEALCSESKPIGISQAHVIAVGEMF